MPFATARYTRGEACTGLLWEHRRRGIRQAVAMGLAVKVNSVLIPGINEGEMPLIARQVKEPEPRS